MYISYSRTATEFVFYAQLMLYTLLIFDSFNAIDKKYVYGIDNHRNNYRNSNRKPVIYQYNIRKHFSTTTGMWRPNILVVKAVDEHGHKGKCGHNPPCGNKFV